VYFGKQDDPSSLRKYAEWVEGLTQDPSKSPSLDSSSVEKHADIGELKTIRRIQRKTTSVPTGATISDLSLAFLDAKRKHSHYYDYRTVCRFLKPYSEMGTAEFDAYCLLQIQQEFDHYGYARKQVNNTVGFVRQMFRWGEARRLVPVGQYAHLKTLEPLREGRENDE
jgi:hypothetical protein